MTKQLSVKTAVCSEYQRLLEESQRALEIWNEHRAEFCQCRFSGEKQVTNSCDCKRSMRELMQCCKTTNATAHSVNGCQEWKAMLLKTVRTPSPTTNCELERCPFPEGQH